MSLEVLRGIKGSILQYMFFLSIILKYGSGGPEPPRSQKDVGAKMKEAAKKRCSYLSGLQSEQS